MTRFLDARLNSVGGELAASISINQGTSLANYASMTPAQLAADIAGRHVLFGAHGYNVDRAHGIASLSNWERLLQLGQSGLFIGLLWPGDSMWAHGLDYPGEPGVANNAGRMFAEFIDSNFSSAASISFVSHSLGARVLLSAIEYVTLPVRRAVIMAGAIDDNCLSTEFAEAVEKVGSLSLLASHKDEV